MLNVLFLYTALGKSRLAGVQDNITVRIHVQVLALRVHAILEVDIACVSIVSSIMSSAIITFTEDVHHAH